MFNRDNKDLEQIIRTLGFYFVLKKYNGTVLKDNSLNNRK